MVNTVVINSTKIQSAVQRGHIYYIVCVCVDSRKCDWQPVRTFSWTTPWRHFNGWESLVIWVCCHGHGHVHPLKTCGKSRGFNPSICLRLGAIHWTSMKFPCCWTNLVKIYIWKVHEHPIGSYRFLAWVLISRDHSSTTFIPVSVNFLGFESFSRLMFNSRLQT